MQVVFVVFSKNGSEVVVLEDNVVVLVLQVSLETFVRASALVLDILFGFFHGNGISTERVFHLIKRLIGLVLQRSCKVVNVEDRVWIFFEVLINQLHFLHNLPELRSLFHLITQTTLQQISKLSFYSFADFHLLLLSEMHANLKNSKSVKRDLLCRHFIGNQRPRPRIACIADFSIHRLGRHIIGSASFALSLFGHLRYFV